MAKMGCPTKYNKRMVAKAREYLKTYKEQGDIIPSLASLSLFMGIDKDTVYAWADKHSDISSVVKELKSTQEQVLLNGSLNGSMNPSIAKLILHKHEYSERKEVDITSGGKTIESVQREIIK